MSHGCRPFLPFLEVFGDGELSADKVLEVEQHLAECRLCRERVRLNAALRADNVGGIAYYEKMGFSSWKIDKGVPLKSGRPVDRIFLRYTVRRAEQAPDT